jgi:hypothetical protein
MVNPIDGGLVGNADFLPTVAATKRWLDNNSGPSSWQLADMRAKQTLKEREEAEEWQMTREEIDARNERARLAKLKIRDAAKGKTFFGPQQHRPEKLIAALQNLESINGESQ